MTNSESTNHTTEEQVQVMKNYISYLEDRLAHSNRMHDQAMEMLKKFVDKWKSTNDFT